MPTEELTTVLSGFEALSSMLERFITAHETDQLSGEVLFAVVRAKDATDRAAALIRERLRQ